MNKNAFRIEKHSLTFVNQYFWKSESISIHFNPFSFAGTLKSFWKHKDEIENILIGINRPSIGFTETNVIWVIEDHDLHFEGFTCIKGDSE